MHGTITSYHNETGCGIIEDEAHDVWHFDIIDTLLSGNFSLIRRGREVDFRPKNNNEVEWMRVL